MTNNDLVASFIEVKIKEQNDFLKIAETLTRIGIASKKDNILYQSCHILHKQGRYYIVHFKELFALDGKQTDFSEEDKSRRNRIATLLADWGLLTIISPESKLEPKASMGHIKIIAFKDKNNWQLQSKYTIGIKK
jgi:hypothetical protein